MLRGKKRTFALSAAPAIAPSGAESAAPLGTVRAALHSRASREVLEDGAERASETVYALIDRRDAPPGGFVRGMTLTAGNEAYRMLTPVCLGRLWSVKCVRTHL